MQHRDVDYYADLVDRLFCRPSAPYGEFVRIGEPVVMAADTIVSAQLHRPGDKLDQYELLLFDGIEGFAGDLWEYGVRSLLRLDALNHPALPKIVSGSFDISERVAFTLTEYPGNPFDVGEAVAWAHLNRTAALEQFSLLLDALSELHGARILHRNLTVGALRWTVAENGDALKLCGFEMSTLIGDILRRVGQRAPGHRESLRQLYLTPRPGMEAARHHAYLPPETHPYLFDHHADGRHDWTTSDVFGLGVFGWELFCGAIPTTVPGAYADLVAAEGSAIRPALARLHEAMRAHLTTRSDLPEPLTELIKKMLYSDPRGRDTPFELAQHMVRNWETLYGTFDGQAEQRPYLIAFMPDQSVETVYIDRKWISHDPIDAPGRAELKAFLERELNQAELVNSPRGALGFVAGRGRDDELRDAQSVLIGERAVWFCSFLWNRGLAGRRTEVDQVLMIKFLANREHARELVTARPRRRIGPFELVPFRPPQQIEVSDYPSWRPLTESVIGGRRRHPDDIEFLQSLDFLREYQRTALNARWYPFRRIGNDGPGPAILEVDMARDDAWRHRSPMLTAYSRDPRRRPAFGDFFSQLDDEKTVIQLQVFPGRGDRPPFNESSIEVDFLSKKDDDTIEVSPSGGGSVSVEGWIRPRADSGTHPQLLRQERALLALENQTALVRTLRSPASINLSRGRRSTDSGPKLDGNAPQIIDEMLALQPFYALQGPPGSGKTVVAVRALCRYLTAEPGARVLVSAQSNYALDHLARDLIKLIKARLPEALVLRWASDRAEDDDEDTGSIDRAVRPYTLNALTAQVVKDILATLQNRGNDDRSAQETRLAEQWAATVRSNQIELSDRITAGASIVLATCSMSATLLNDIRGAGDHFDWVLVEEAAKAWPTEIITPLVLGVRWTLIGDHRQLGAHRGAEVREFLESLAQDDIDTDMRPHYEARHSRLQRLNLFGSLFDGQPAEAQGATPLEAGSTPPLGRLKMQFRMHPDIAEPVGRAFYPEGPGAQDDDGLPRSFLTTGTVANRAHGVTRPGYLAGRALVWIDTGSLDECTDRPRWHNPGEVELIARLVEQMRPQPLTPEKEGIGSLVVLTPYTAQVRALNAKGVLAGRVHTVHSFQGKQADRVIVSLVRSRRLGGTVASNVGHVGQDEVVNVLLSRAQTLLVLVGNLRHFADHGGACWQTITTVVKQYGTVVDASLLEQL